MSACIRILKPIDGIHFIPAKEYGFKPDKDAVDPYFEYGVWYKEFVGCWSDDIVHQTIDLTMCHLNKRYHNQIKEIERRFSKYVTKIEFQKNIEKVIPVEEVYYSQGSSFKLKKFFFKRWNTIYYAFDKEHMENLLLKFLDLKDNDEHRNRKLYTDCLELFKDGMIFEIAY